MKLQHLAVIFVIIILPITLVLSNYIQTHITSIQLESQYTTRLMSATHDAALAFQLNTANNGYSTGQDSKMRDVEAAIETFYNSLSLAMGSEGYTQEELQLHTPAILCTLYDGYYIYTKYNDKRYANTVEYHSGKDSTSFTKDTADTINPNNLTEDKYTYGLKPFITYSCRYIYGSDDFVVNYTLDNTITIIGNVGGTNVTKSGHLINLPNFTELNFDVNDNANAARLDSYIDTRINGSLDEHEILQENLVTLLDNGDYEYTLGNDHSHTFNYVIYNSQKFYDNEDGNYFYYGSDYRKNIVSSTETINILRSLFSNNKRGLEYYREAVKFSKWVQDNLSGITQAHSKDLEGDPLFNSSEDYIELSSSDYIFSTSDDNDPLVSNSIFNEHRMNVIKNSIITNLNTVMSTFSATGSSEFSMPKISDPEWYNIENNVTFVTFLQGLPMKSKTYNHYCVVSNNTNKETVNADSIYLIDSDDTYHKPGCETLISNLKNGTCSINGAYSAADFERKRILVTGADVSAWTNAEDISAFFYPQNAEACYDCIVNAANLNNVDNIIMTGGKLRDKDGNEIVNDDSTLRNYRNIYLRALARERYNLYTINGYFGN